MRLLSQVPLELDKCEFFSRLNYLCVAVWTAVWIAVRSTLLVAECSTQPFREAACPVLNPLK